MRIRTHDAETSIRPYSIYSPGLDHFPPSSASFGIVYVEAWAYGKPVVGGTAPASRELIQRHSGGLLSDGSAADIAVQLSRLIDNPAERRAFGESGRAAVLSDYSLERVMATHHAVWNWLMEEAG